MRRGYDLSFTMGSQVFRLPAATGLGRAHFYLLGQENDTAVGRSGSGIGGQGIPTDLRVQGGHGVHFCRT